MNSSLVFAMRQAAALAMLLIGAGLITSRLRPLEATDRDIVATPWLWAAVLWIVVLVIHAAIFDAALTARIERVPLAAAAAIAAATFIIGLATFDVGPVARRIVYLAANAFGALAFWWAVFSLVLLAATRATRPVST